MLNPLMKRASLQAATAPAAAAAAAAAAGDENAGGGSSGSAENNEGGGSFKRSMSMAGAAITSSLLRGFGRLPGIAKSAGAGVGTAVRSRSIGMWATSGGGDEGGGGDDGGQVGKANEAEDGSVRVKHSVAWAIAKPPAEQDDGPQTFGYGEDVPDKPVPMFLRRDEGAEAKDPWGWDVDAESSHLPKAHADAAERQPLSILRSSTNVEASSSVKRKAKGAGSPTTGMDPVRRIAV